eukprot:COSAG01_NODE_8514_length_2758_cov_11.722828_3_plen_217_part_00
MPVLGGSSRQAGRQAGGQTADAQAGRWACMQACRMQADRQHAACSYACVPEADPPPQSIVLGGASRDSLCMKAHLCLHAAVQISAGRQARARSTSSPGEPAAVCRSTILPDPDGLGGPACGCCPVAAPWLPPPPACWPRAPRQRLSAAPTRPRRSERRCALQLEAVYACFPRVSVASDGCRYGGGKQPESACEEVGQAGRHRCCSLLLPVCCCCCL